jgi:hypothetical protein
MGSRPRIPERYGIIQFGVRLSSLIVDVAALSFAVYVNVANHLGDAWPLLYTGLGIVTLIDSVEVLGLAMKPQQMRRVPPAYIVLVEVIVMIILGLSWVVPLFSGWRSADAPPLPSGPPEKRPGWDLYPMYFGTAIL